MSEVAPELLVDAAIVSEVRDVYPMFAAMRRSQGVARVELPMRAVYIVLRYDDVSAVLRDPETFSSRIMRQVMGPVMGRTILEMDGHDHTRYRGLVQHAFRPKAIERYATELVEPVVQELLDGIVRGGGKAELVSQLTTNYPLTIIARMLGIPIRDYAQFQKWSLDLIGYKANQPEPGLSASRALKDYLRPIVEQRKLDPKDDLISELLAARVDDHRLTDDDIFGFLLLLLPAGAETTFRLLGNMLSALLSHPDQLDEVRRDPEQLTWALEETLRWEPPLLGTARETTRAVTLRGVEIPERSMVSAMVGPANRDEEHYPDPDRFDIHRHADDHLSFGLGKHFCLGYHLARLEVLTAMRAVLDRLPNVRLDPAQESYIQGVSFRSPNRLPVLFDA
ncbi:MAG: cytochrome P450 [Deltaproteobacteria bacterium]|nr:cytochrome P450 [Deltaproteobacteria bacterium]MBI3390125.1 cytochrome P450 [Deltaproteobacteria bacterium]